METQKIYDDGFLRIIRTPKGPSVYLAYTRVHHWTGGVFLAGIGLMGLLFDDNKERRKWYGLYMIFGGLLILDDLPDFLSYLQDNLEAEGLGIHE